MASADGTMIVRHDVRIEDADGNFWYIQQNGQIIRVARDGTTTVDGGTSNVTAIGYLNGQIVQQNDQNLWWTKTYALGAYDGWSPNGGSHTNPFPQSPNGTVIIPNDASPLVDSNGNLWWIDNSRVVENGITDTATNRVIEVAYKNGVIWQENSDKLWWPKTNDGYRGWGDVAGLTDGPGTLNNSPSRTWIGGYGGNGLGGINRANNPGNWSPNGVPQPNEALSMQRSDTMVIDGDDLKGDTLTIDYLNGGVAIALIDAKADLAAKQDVQGGNLAINAVGNDSINFVDGLPYLYPTITLVANARLTLTGAMHFANYTISGDPGSAIVNNGTLSYFVNGLATITPDLLGTGVVNVSRVHDGSGEIEVKRAVASGQTFNLSGDSSYSSKLIIDQANLFAGVLNVTAHDVSEVILEGLHTRAASYDIHDDTLKLYSSENVVIDTMSLRNPTAVPMTVTETALQGPEGPSQPVVEIGFAITPDGLPLPQHVEPPPPPPPPNGGGDHIWHFMVTNQSRSGDPTGSSDGHPYNGPVPGLTDEIISITADNINITATIPNVFIHTGSGMDAIDVSSHGGSNVLDGGTGSNFLVGGSGKDTFFVDNRGPTADIWSTVVGFHAGDAATIWGVTLQDFNLGWVDDQGAVGFTGVTLHATADAKPTASLTLAGFTTHDLVDGNLSVLFGHDAASGSDYMYVHGN